MQRFNRLLHFDRRMFVQHEHSVRREIIIAGQRLAGEEIVHGFVELDADG